MAGINELKQKIESDAGFKASLESAADANDFFEKIKSAGFEIAPEEFIKLEGGEVSDDELEAVAGGFSHTILLPGFRPVDVIKDLLTKF